MFTIAICHKFLHLGAKKNNCSTQLFVPGLFLADVLRSKQKSHTKKRHSFASVPINRRSTSQSIYETNRNVYLLSYSKMHHGITIRYVPIRIFTEAQNAERSHFRFQYIRPQTGDDAHG